MTSEIFQNEQYAHELLHSCHSAWMEGRNLDVNLCVGDRKISAHRLVLCGLSDYFKTLFQMDGQDSSDIVLKEVDFDSLYSLVKYAYTGSIEINQSNVQKLLGSADYFQVTTVKASCEEFLMGHLDTDSCIDLMLLAEKYCLDQLSKECCRYFGEQFNKIRKKDQFLELPSNILIEVLRCNDLVLLRHKMPLSHEEMELTLFKGVLRYICLPEFRRQNVVEILMSVRLPFIKKKEIAAALKKWPNLEGNKHIEDILQLLEKGKKSKMPALWLTPRKCAIKLKKDAKFCANGGHLLRFGGGRMKSSFDDSSVGIDACITQIKLWIRLWDGRPVISCIAIKYSNGASFKHGERAGGANHVSKHVIELLQGEYITQVKGRHGWMIDQLCFKTEDEREFGPFGGGGGSSFICKPTGLNRAAYLHAFSGDIVHTQGNKCPINMGFIWKYY